MNILIDLLPEHVEIDGKKYPINTDFRISILFELLMQDKSILDREKVYIALNLYYPKIPHDLVQAVDKMLWFYRCGKDDEDDSVKNGSTAGNGRAGMIYSFEHDAEYIYSAFLDQYGIDLQDIEHLHWWKFRALFKGLKEDNLIVKIMGYRSIEITNDMSDSEKKYYRKMKRIYALPDNRTQEEKERDFTDAIASLF